MLRISMVRLLALLLLAMGAGCGAGGTLPGGPVAIAPATGVQSRSYHFDAAGEDMPYTLFVPSSYDASRPMPLIVALHGLGSNPTQIMRYQGLTELAEARGYIVVAPMGYNSRGWYGSRGPGNYSRRGNGVDDPDNLGELSEQDVLNVLGIVRDEFNIDADEIFLMGHSMGGGGTWYLGIEYPELWAGLAPVAPAIYTSPDALEAIADKPVIVIMGDADRLVRVEVTRQWVEKMRELGMDYEYVEIPGGDHTRIIAANPTNMARIFDFFDAVRATP